MSLALECDLVIVVGSPNSSNSTRLREVAGKRGVAAHLVDSAADITETWLNGVKRVGVTAGASAPEVLVLEVVARLQAMGAENVRSLAGGDENIVFPLPREIAG